MTRLVAVERDRPLPTLKCALAVLALTVRGKEGDPGPKLQGDRYSEDESDTRSGPHACGNTGVSKALPDYPWISGDS